jgi:hypothetical protein
MEQVSKLKHFVDLGMLGGEEADHDLGGLGVDGQALNEAPPRSNLRTLGRRYGDVRGT